MFQRLIGVVLCGGKSLRMGSDKGLLMKDGKTWAEISAGKLLLQALPVMLSVNAEQAEQYAKLLTEYKLVLDHSQFPGPLRGILSAHKQFPQGDLVVLACDMIEMEAETIQQLLSAYQQFPGHDFYAWKNAEYWEPFCGIYTAAGLKAYLLLLEAGTITKYSMHEMLETGNTYSLSVGRGDSFRNYNSLPIH